MHNFSFYCKVHHFRTICIWHGTLLYSRSKPKTKRLHTLFTRAYLRQQSEVVQQNGNALLRHYSILTTHARSAGPWGDPEADKCTCIAPTDLSPPHQFLFPFCLQILQLHVRRLPPTVQAVVILVSGCAMWYQSLGRAIGRIPAAAEVHDSRGESVFESKRDASVNECAMREEPNVYM